MGTADLRHRAITWVRVTPGLAPRARIIGVGVFRAIRQPALDISKVVQDLIIGQYKITHHLVVPVQYRIPDRTICVTGHENEAHSRVFIFQLGHHVQVLLHFSSA